MHSDFLILGGGFAGLGAGVALKRAKVDSLILEGENETGGLCRNQTLHGCDFDFGPKILILDDSPNSREILSFLGKNYEKYPMQESIYLTEYGLMDFPLQRNLIDLPQPLRKDIIDDIISSEKHPQEIHSYKDWLIHWYGKRLSEMVLIPYEEKKWKMNLNNMSYEWALRRPINVSKEEVIEGSKRKLAPNRYYYYPRHGNISVLSKSISAHAGTILTNKKVTEINLAGKFVIASKKKYSYNHLISTLPLDYVVDIITGVPAKLKIESKSILKHLGIIVFNLVFKGNFDLRGTAIYFPERRFVFRRVTILQNLCSALRRKEYTPLSVEISIESRKEINEEELFRRVCSDLEKIPQFFSMGKPVEYAVLYIDFAYPLQMRGLSAHLSTIQRYLEKKDVSLCGRGGTFDYCNSDQAYKQGKEVIKCILGRYEKQ